MSEDIFMKVSIVLPTYNERENIKILIPRIFKVLKKNKINGSMIVVDDSSPDKTALIVQRLKKTYPITLIERSGKLGIGSAYITGFKKTLEDKADVVFEMDADLSHDPRYIPDFTKKIEQGFDVVIGSRKVEGGDVVGWNWYRKAVSAGGNFIGKRIAGVDISDLTSGYRAFKRKVVESIGLNKIKSDGYAFQLEVLSRCINKGFTVGVIPIMFYDRTAGKSKLSRRDMIDFFWTALKIRLGKIK